MSPSTRRYARSRRQQAPIGLLATSKGSAIGRVRLYVRYHLFQLYQHRWRPVKGPV